MKIYDVKKVKGGYQVVWFYDSSRYGSYLEYQNDVYNGFYKNRSDAENHANNLSCE